MDIASERSVEYKAMQRAVWCVHKNPVVPVYPGMGQSGQNGHTGTGGREPYFIAFHSFSASTDGKCDSGAYEK